MKKAQAKEIKISMYRNKLQGGKKLRLEKYLNPFLMKSKTNSNSGSAWLTAEVRDERGKFQ